MAGVMSTPHTEIMTDLGDQPVLDNRTIKAAQIFNVPISHYDPVVHDELKSTMLKLEALSIKETRLWWDCTTLQSYVDKAMVPRGLRIKKFPTFVYPDTFKKEWEGILSDCSLKLINLIIKHERDTLSQLQTEITTIKTSMQNQESTQDYKRLYAEMESNISKMEDQITVIKQRKFERDTMDYQRGDVYTWRQNRETPRSPHSILKKKKNFQHQQGQQHTNRFQSNRVTFSHPTGATGGATATSEDYSDSSDEWRSDQQREDRRGTSNRTQNTASLTTPNPRSKNGVKEPAASTAGDRYPRRNRVPRTTW